MALNLVLLAAILANSLELRAQMIGGHVLQVLLIPHGRVPVMMTTRTFLGCYIEVQVQDAQGIIIGHIGPRATCTTPSLPEFQRLIPDDAGLPLGGQVFGAEFDLLSPGRVRLESDEMVGLVPGQDYRLVVLYHNYDEKFLGAKRKSALKRRYGNFWSSAIELTSEPISFRCCS